jgi:hypothetical protein
MKTLWNAIHTVKPDFCIRKPLDAPWEEIPTSEEIIQAIKPEECKIYQLLCNARDKRLKDK